MSNALTAAQHARIRLHLALIPAYALALNGWWDLIRRMPIGSGGDAHFARDFAAVAYVPGLIANRGDASALYDLNARAAILAQIVPAMQGRRYPPFYGPQLSMLFAPLARLPLGAALTVWMAATIAVYLACGLIVWKACPRLRDRGGAVALLLLADPSLYYVLSFGQISALALACVAAGLVAMRAGRPFLMGVAIGSLIYKPSFGVAPAVVFLAAREWRVVLGALTGAALQLGAAALFWGPSILAEYLRSLVRLAPDMGDESALYHLHSWRGLFEILGLDARVAMAAYLMAATVVLILAYRCWRSSAPPAVRYAVLLIATVLVNPHMYVYDFIILMPAFLLLWDWSDELPRESARRAVTWLLYLSYLSAGFAIVAVMTRVQVSVLALSALMWIVYRVAAKPEPFRTATKARKPEG